MTAKEAKQILKTLATPEVAQSSRRFFKTGPGQYGEGDIFIGIKVPSLRAVSREFRSLPLEEIRLLLNSPVHEERHLALMILVLQVAKCKDPQRRVFFDFYLDNTAFINNWDLVDCSAPQVVGACLLDKSREPLFQLAQSKSLWERRIAIVSTQHFIRHDQFADTLALCQKLLNDPEDLIQKACGWMLREVGAKARHLLEAFLDQHAREMPRTMLRYAIEHFSPDKRRAYLKKKPSSSGNVCEGPV